MFRHNGDHRPWVALCLRGRGIGLSSLGLVYRFVLGLERMLCVGRFLIFCFGKSRMEYLPLMRRNSFAGFEPPSVELYAHYRVLERAGLAQWCVDRGFAS